MYHNSDDYYYSKYYDYNFGKGVQSYIEYKIIFEVGNGKSYTGFVTPSEFNKIREALKKDKCSFAEDNNSITFNHPENYLCLKPASKKGSVQTCAYDATSDYFESCLGRKLSREDLNWYTNHPNVIGEGLKEAHTLDVLQALIHPYGIGISQVIIPESSILSTANNKWKNYLDCSPLTFLPTPTGAGWLYEKILTVDPEAKPGIIRVPDDSWIKGPCITFDVISSANAALSSFGHATYRGPRAIVKGSSIAIRYDFLSNIHYKNEPELGEDFEITLEVDVDNSIFCKTDKETTKFKDLFGYSTTKYTSGTPSSLGDCIKLAGKDLCKGVSVDNPWALPSFIKDLEQVFNHVFGNTNKSFKDFLPSCSKPTWIQLNSWLFSLELNPHTANSLFSSCDILPVSEKTKDLLKIVDIQKDKELSEWWSKIEKYKGSIKGDILKDACSLMVLWMIYNPFYNKNFSSLVGLYGNDRSRVFTIQVALMHLLQKAAKVSFEKTYTRSTKNKSLSKTKPENQSGDLDPSFDALPSVEQFKVLEKIFDNLLEKPLISSGSGTYNQHINLELVPFLSSIAEVIKPNAKVSSQTWANAMEKVPNDVKSFMNEKRQHITLAFRNTSLFPSICSWGRSSGTQKTHQRAFITAVLSGVLYARNMGIEFDLEELLSEILRKKELTKTKAQSNPKSPHQLILEINKLVVEFIDKTFAFESMKERNESFRNFFKISLLAVDEGTSKEQWFFTSNRTHKVGNVETNLIETNHELAAEIYLETVVDCLIEDDLPVEDAKELAKLLEKVLRKYPNYVDDFQREFMLGWLEAQV